MSRPVELDVGLVVAAHGRHYVVESPEGRRLTCHPRGKKSDCVVGDRVRWMPTSGADEGVIEHIEPRRNLLFRQDDWKTKSFAANLDQLPSHGFTVACFPLNVVGGSAGPARVVAILDAE